MVRIQKTVLSKGGIKCTLKYSYTLKYFLKEKTTKKYYYVNLFKLRGDLNHKETFARKTQFSNTPHYQIGYIMKVSKLHIPITSMEIFLSVNGFN